MLLSAVAVAAPDETPRDVRGVRVVEHLGDTVDLSLTFTDQRGAVVPLSRYFRGNKPVLLTLNYYGCETLCNVQLNALVRVLRKLELTPGKDFTLLTVSIDPRETPTLAADKREAYLAQLTARSGKSLGPRAWDFLVGKQVAITRLANAVGFGYRYDRRTDQFAHPALAFFLSPAGKITRYLYGIDYPVQQLRFALIDASQGRLGSTVQKILLSCFSYDARTGRYTGLAWALMRIAGGLVLACLIGFLLWQWRRERAVRKTEKFA